MLLTEAEYEVVREIIEDERQQRAIREVALRNAVGRMAIRWRLYESGD